MHPKVTLIGDPWMTRTVVFGRKRFIFHGGEGIHVPVAVAVKLIAEKARGQRVFKVEGMPVLINATHPPVAGIPGVFPRQRKLAECRL